MQYLEELLLSALIFQSFECLDLPLADQAGGDCQVSGDLGSLFTSSDAAHSLELLACGERALGGTAGVCRVFESLGFGDLFVEFGHLCLELCNGEGHDGFQLLV